MALIQKAQVQMKSTWAFIYENHVLNQTDCLRKDAKCKIQNKWAS